MRTSTTYSRNSNPWYIPHQLHARVDIIQPTLDFAYCILTPATTIERQLRTAVTDRRHHTITLGNLPPGKSSATPMHQRALPPQLNALTSHKHLQRAVEALLAVAFALDEFAAQGREGGGVAYW